MNTLPAGARPWAHDLARWIGRYLYRPRYRITVTGMQRLPRTGGLVLVANHSSLLEPQLLFGFVPRRIVFLVKRELFAGGLGTLLRWIGQLPIDRGTPDRAALLAAVGMLRSGGVIGVFPEGTRGAGAVEGAERGAAWLVRASGATVVPIAVRGTHKPDRVGLRPRIDVRVGQPFTPEVGKGGAGLAQATELIRDNLADLVRTLDQVRAEREIQ